jgi:hypothetical protein
VSGWLGLFFFLVGVLWCRCVSFIFYSSLVYVDNSVTKVSDVLCLFGGSAGF